jgi:hypothetical protein
MHHHIAVIQQEPALLGLPFDAPFFLMFLFGCLQHPFGKRVEHPVAGAVANDEIICKRRDVFDVEKQDVFALFVLQGGDDLMCKFECVQISPLFIFAVGIRESQSSQKDFSVFSVSLWLTFFNGAENKRV